MVLVHTPKTEPERRTATPKSGLSSRSTNVGGSAFKAGTSLNEIELEIARRREELNALRAQRSADRTSNIIERAKGSQERYASPLRMAEALMDNLRSRNPSFSASTPGSGARERERGRRTPLALLTSDAGTDGDGDADGDGDGDAGPAGEEAPATPEQPRRPVAVRPPEALDWEGGGRPGGGGGSPRGEASSAPFALGVRSGGPAPPRSAFLDRQAPAPDRPYPSSLPRLTSPGVKPKRPGGGGGGGGGPRPGAALVDADPGRFGFIPAAAAAATPPARQLAMGAAGPVATTPPYEGPGGGGGGGGGGAYGYGYRRDSRASLASLDRSRERGEGAGAGAGALAALEAEKENRVRPWREVEELRTELMKKDAHLATILADKQKLESSQKEQTKEVLDLVDQMNKMKDELDFKTEEIQKAQRQLQEERDQLEQQKDAEVQAKQQSLDALKAEVQAQHAEERAAFTAQGEQMRALAAQQEELARLVRSGGQGDDQLQADIDKLVAQIATLDEERSRELLQLRAELRRAALAKPAGLGAVARWLMALALWGAVAAAAYSAVLHDRLRLGDFRRFTY